MTATGGVASQPLPPRPRRYRTFTSAVVETGAVLASSARLLWRHWPVLFALYFAGAAAKVFISIGAVQASKLSGVLGVMIIILGPVVTLISLVLMLRVVRPSLPWLAAATADPLPDESGDAPRRPPTLMDHLASALVPFLAVYASWGYLQDDFSGYVYDVLYDASFNDPRVFDDPTVLSRELDDRLPFNTSIALISVIVVAIVLRWLLNTFRAGRRWPVLGILGAYVEVIWIIVSVAALNQVRDPVTSWLRERKVVKWLLELWDRFVEALGPLTGLVRGAGDWLVGAIASADTVIVVPLAWLAVGAVVYGHRLAPPAPSGSELLQRASKRWNALPKPVRVVGANATSDLRERFMPLVHGVRTLAQAGLAPMLFFCLSFLAAQTANDLLWEVERVIIGPQDLDEVWRSVVGPLAIFNDAVGVVLLATLLAAAVDRVLRLQPATPADSASAAAPEGDAQDVGSRA
ncbi:hypothetical protein [Phytohabitans houttuyneae]|uniref:Uncharacterized protein n=1 Tax=Phytohabitans houttuyneae TaxID=1076126 RepID=A0A6V8K784_9ACTN|nr:hypothetical protein [Phytohabitans houttuyneae]GFJ79380.1 hypothetical protein Phou_035600 [Phytohabitans houttuyneae]